MVKMVCLVGCAVAPPIQSWPGQAVPAHAALERLRSVGHQRMRLRRKAQGLQREPCGGSTARPRARFIAQ